MSTYFIGDTQRTYDETEAFVYHANGRDDIDFVIHGGDYTEFGMTKEFGWAVERLNQLRVPYAGLIGNHDTLGNGHEVLRSYSVTISSTTKLSTCDLYLINAK